jgi:hypothetical protein
VTGGGRAKQRTGRGKGSSDMFGDQICTALARPGSFDALSVDRDEHRATFNAEGGLG